MYGVNLAGGCPVRIFKPNRYEVLGDITRGFIEHRDGSVTVFIIDTSDLPIVLPHRWNLRTDKSRPNDVGYVKSTQNIRLNVLLGDPPEGMLVDHHNRNTLDNRRENLRVCTIQENAFNSKVQSNSSSGVKGVSFDSSRSRKPWIAQYKMNKKVVRIGRFATKEEAMEARKKAVESMHGEFYRET